MDKRLQKIVDEAQEKFGLDAYWLERHAINKERDTMGNANYTFIMEWFPNGHNEPIEEDYNPEGTAIVEYNIQKQYFSGVSFVQGESFSAKTHFPGKTADEVAAWLEKETGLQYKQDFKLTQANANGFQFKSDIDGIYISPSCIIEVDFDDAGKLISYHSYGTIPTQNQVEKSKFTLTLEEIEPIVKKQLQLVKFPSESEKRFVPVYAIEEVYVTVNGERVIPFMEHERSEVIVEEVIVWDKPLEEQINREEITFSSEASTEDAFRNVSVEEKLTLSDEQIEQSKHIVRDVLRTEYPNDSEKWMLSKLQRQENFIEAHCKINEIDSTPFNRKVVVFMNPETMAVLNYFDNGSMSEIFDGFSSAEEAVVTHEEAFEKMVSYITLDPAYVYDKITGKYILCGLLDAAEAVDAVTGEIILLEDI